ncbi:hypothetical protein FEM48_Zijuj03G0146400 [Ziziphus jujuba var. spinosa]|uniref:non-specific serine/threonine protein kinase n=1 Tax=Ziziphus jujuba var. spinosa TaxID=714518 RepID=A0A978VQW7_ZIZJJ|nr:hypothetical protein FEM48_Zijuj03G0146400 [Ziziphus jujuba var. spinosa]
MRSTLGNSWNEMRLSISFVQKPLIVMSVDLQRPKIHQDNIWKKQDTVTPINLFGYDMAFLGVAYYNHSKLQVLEAKKAQKKIAVKRLKTLSAKAEMEFAVEVEILGRVRHKNLLGLRGFYAGGDERLIVYDYMPNHSLITHLHGQLSADCLLDWPRRMNIIIGSAEGVKRDIVQWVTPYVQKGAFNHIADPRLKGKFDRDQLKSTVMLALKCTDGSPENRPSMFEVVAWLKNNGSVGKRKKDVSDLEEKAMVDEDEGKDKSDTGYEGFAVEQYGGKMIRAKSQRR